MALLSVRFFFCYQVWPLVEGDVFFLIDGAGQMTINRLNLVFRVVRVFTWFNIQS